MRPWIYGILFFSTVQVFANNCEGPLAWRAQGKGLSPHVKIRPMDPGYYQLDPTDFGLPKESTGILESYELTDGSMAYSLTVKNGLIQQTRFIGVSDPEEIRYLLKIKAHAKTILAFYGFSGAGYNDPHKMLSDATSEMLKFPEEEREQVGILIGATPQGIGQLYGTAQSLGFGSTIGIVSSKGKKYLSLDMTRNVELIFIVGDGSWGGFPGDVKDGTFADLSPTSQAMVASSDVLVGIGGGEVAGGELQAAFKLGKNVKYYDADSSREIALQKWQDKVAKLQPGETAPPQPTDFSAPAKAYVKNLIAQTKPQPSEEGHWRKLQPEYYGSDALRGQTVRMTYVDDLGLTQTAEGKVLQIPHVERDAREELSTVSYYQIQGHNQSIHQARVKEILVKIQ